jgi:hypothetical protein
LRVGGDNYARYGGDWKNSGDTALWIDRFDYTCEKQACSDFVLDPKLRMQMTERVRPPGGIDLRKYAAICFALAQARGVLLDAVSGDIQKTEAQRILDLTALHKIAESLGCHEADLAIDWNEHLTKTELDRLRGF